MNMSSGMKELVKALRSEARIADRPGQYDRLNEIADQLKKQEELIRADERSRPLARDERRSLAAVYGYEAALLDLRAKVEALPGDLYGYVYVGTVLDLIDGDSNE
jgi:hypothetical protein